MLSRTLLFAIGAIALSALSNCGNSAEEKPAQNSLYAAENMLRNDELYQSYPALSAIDFYHYDSLLNCDYAKLSFDNQCFFAIGFFEAEYDLGKNRHDSLYKIIEPLVDSIIQNQDSISHKQNLELPLALLGAKLSGDRMLGQFSGSSSASFSKNATIMLGRRPIYSMILDAKNNFTNSDDHSWPLMIDSALNRYSNKFPIPIMQQLHADYLESIGDTIGSVSKREEFIRNGVYVFLNCDKVISYYTLKQDWNKVASYIPLCKERSFEFQISALIPYYLLKGDTAYAIDLLEKSVADTLVWKSNISARVQLAELYIRTRKYTKAEELVSTFPYHVPVPFWPEPYEGFNYRAYQRNLLLQFCRYYVVNDVQGMQDHFWKYGTDLDQIKKDAADLMVHPLSWY